ncbi:hypothetical protein AgCh_004689 [Apium graveolens]
MGIRGHVSGDPWTFLNHSHPDKSKTSTPVRCPPLLEPTTTIQRNEFLLSHRRRRGTQKDQGKKKETEVTKQKRLEEMREQIRKEKEAKLELKIQKRMQLKEEKLLAKSRIMRTQREPTPEFISDDNEEKQKDLKDMIYELQRKMDKESGMEIGKALTPFIQSLEAIPRQRDLKYNNFDSFDGLGNPEEHLNYVTPPNPGSGIWVVTPSFTHV